MSDVLEPLAFAAAVVVAIGYLPQVVHTWRARCCVGISLPAWIMWLGASVVFLLHALEIGDLVFSALMAVQVLAHVTIVGLAVRHRGMACEMHGGARSPTSGTV